MGIYAINEDAIVTIKDNLLVQLNLEITNIRTSWELLLLGDFNDNVEVTGSSSGPI